MQLTIQTDYTFRLLIYLGKNSETLVTTAQVSDFYKISKNHLTKIVNTLGKHHYIELRRGRYGGGMKLKKKPEDINIGDIIRLMEPMELVECFKSVDKNFCLIDNGTCKLKHLLNEASSSFLKVLSQKNLSDLL